jgi:hypothetical protein
MLATYGTVYHGHFSLLQRFDECTAPYRLLERIHTNLHNTAWCIEQCPF